MKLVIALMVCVMLVLSGTSPSVAADRGGNDRQESDELRADIRLRRLKKVKEMEDAAKQQQPSQGYQTGGSKKKPGG